jgi:hypothetical protein
VRVIEAASVGDTMRTNDRVGSMVRARPPAGATAGRAAARLPSSQVLHERSQVTSLMFGGWHWKFDGAAIWQVARAFVNAIVAGDVGGAPLEL